MNAVGYIIHYLKDWKNLLVHAVIGVGILVAALYIPVKPAYKIVLLAVVIVFNTLRMKLTSRKTGKKL